MAFLKTESRSPFRALLHPLWLGSLAMLALNDHLLKGSGHLPGWVTGKLSDFAGLLVAPLLLAGLLQLKRRRGWAIAHVAVGVVFAAIQLSPALSAAWSAMMGAVGVSWVTTMDATDLIALPMLLVSWHWLGQAQARRAAGNARRSAEAGAAAVGLLACVATSQVSEPTPDEPPPEDLPEGESGGDWNEDDAVGEEPRYPDITAGAYLHNGTDTDRVVRIRALRAGVDLDCDVIADAPGELLTPELFDVAESWTLPAGTNQSLEHAARDFPCQATLVEVDGVEPRLMFWAPEELPPHSVPGWGATPSDPGQLAIVGEARNRLAWTGAENFSFELAPVDSECALQPDADRVAWSSPLPVGDYRLSALEYGHDGCFEFTLLDTDESVDTWFLCVPETTMTLVAGDDIQISSTQAHSGVRLRAFDGDEIIAELRAESWVTDPEIDAMGVSVVPDFDCGAEVQPSCGTVAAPLHVSVDSPVYGAAQLRPDGTVTHLTDEKTELNLALVHGQQRAAVDSHCAQGPGVVGYDVELVVSYGPFIAE